MDRETKEFVRKRVTEHKETFVEDSLRDFIDFYIKAEKHGEDSGAFSGKYESYLTLWRIDALSDEIAAFLIV